ncbi:MAG: hypothetical protein CMO34_00725 [Verrucomicrobia bacterium]|nr:hypothetical protein [Verrucomicrobiota bacterium]|tara:strand:- start:503 stop:1201 length:699 start_codon:yes stop_codon:yes gene_type:complete
MFAQKQSVEKQKVDKRAALDEGGRNLASLTLKKRGPNLDHYSHLIVGYGFILGPSEGDSAAIIPGKSSAFTLGWLAKWRIAKWYELGFDINYHLAAYHIKQDSMKTVPNTVLHKKEKLIFNNIQAHFFQRFKFKNRYHSTGTFLDIGGYFGYNYRVKNQILLKDNQPQAYKSKSVLLRLKYTEDFQYGAQVRIGLNRFILYGRYRFSALFTKNSGLADFPMYEAGILIGLHQ